VTRAFPDTVVGTDSHTTMINGLGILGWGVGGIEAEAAMLGQPITMLIPHVVGFELTGRLPEGATATDLVLTVVQMLRERGVVGKFVEFYGDGLDHLSLADRATIANMAPEYGATCGIFPVDSETMRYLRFTGRADDRVALVEAYAKAQGMWRDKDTPEPLFTDTLELDISTVEPSLAGPKRPQDRVALSGMVASADQALADMGAGTATAVEGTDYSIDPGDVVIADFSGVLVMPPGEAEADADWALSKQAAEPESHAALLTGEKLGERSGASAMVRAKLGEQT